MNIKSKKELENIIQYERKMWIARMYPQGAPSKVRSITLLYMKALRKVEYYGKLPKTAKICAGGGYIFWKTMYRIIGLITNVSIPPYVFGKGLLIMHLQNIVVSAKVRVGENTCLFHNTTLGIKLGHNTDGKCPVIGNGVTICAGACVLGDVHIEDGITVAANAVVTKSYTEKDVILGGVPAKVIGKNPDWSMQEFADKIIYLGREDSE